MRASACAIHAWPPGYRKMLEQEALIPPGVVVVVAVSSGLDSMVLLDLLVRDSAHRRWQLVVAHLDHRLRGRESRADARWVERTAQALGLRCVVEAADVRGLARRDRVSLEMAARCARHEFLARVARQLHAYCVALAHHADDQTELFFLRVFRGTAVEGLGGMAGVAISPADPHVRLVRPLLNLSRRVLRAYAEARGLKWREDRSNADVRVLRNRLRHKLIPFIERHFQPALTDVVPRLMASLRIEHDWLRTQADKLERGRESDAGFERSHAALQREMVHRELVRLGVVSTTDLIDRLRASPPVLVTTAGGTSLIRNGMRIQRSVPGPAKCGWNSAASCAVELAGKHGRIEYGGRVFQWWHQRSGRRVPGARAGEGGRGVEWFDADRIGARIVLRHWRPGDRFQPIGMGSAVKLQNLFVNQGIERSRRHELTVAEAADGGIFWVEGLRISECYRLDKGTGHLLKWQWSPVAAPEGEGPGVGGAGRSGAR